MQAVKARSYAAVPVESDGQPDTAVPQRRTQTHNYLPSPLRLPFLLSFILVFATCIFLIEIVLRNAQSPADAGLTTTSASTILEKRTIYHPSKVKRSTYIPSSVHCESATNLDQRLTSLSQVSQSLCSDFTATYSAHTKSFPSSIRSAASQWVLDINDVYEQADDVDLTSAYCVPKPSMTQTLAGTQSAAEEEGDPTVVFGCTTTTVSCHCCCAECAGAEISFNVSSFVTKSSIWCAATASAMIAETSQPRTSNAPVTITESAVTSSKAIAQTSYAPTTSQAKSISSSIKLISSSTSSTATIAQISNSPTTSSAVATTTKTASQLLVSTSPTSSKQSTPPSLTSSVLLVSTSSEKASSSVRTTVESAIATSVLVPTSQDESTSGTVAAAPIRSTELVVLTSTESASTMFPISEDLAYASSDDNLKQFTSISSSVRPNVLTESIVHTVSDKTSSSLAPPSTTLNRGFTIANPLSTTANSATESAPPDEVVTRTALPHSLTVVTTTTEFTSWVETTGTDGLPTNVTAVVIRSTVYTTDMTALTAAKSQAANSTASRPPQPSLALSAHEAVVEGTYNSAYYFSALYLPPLMAVLVKALWQALYAAVRLIEPFERMNNPGGAPMRYSLFAEYLSSSLSLDILGSLGRGNLLPLVAGLSFVLVQIGTPLATISMTVESADICIIDGQQRRCDPRWVINTALLRSVEAIAAACMLSIVVIAVLIRRHKSGISSDPSSLASVATLLNHEQLLRDIQSVDLYSNHKAFEKAFDQHACWIGYHTNSEGLTRYGIVGSQALDGSTGHGTLLARGQNYQAVNNPAESSSQVKSSLDSVRILLTDILGLLVPLTLFAIIIAFWFDSRNDVLNEFFNSTTRWPKLVLVSLATISALLTSSIERVVRIVEPFRRLAANYSHDVARPAPPETTLLIKRSGTAYSSLIRSAHLLALNELHGGRMSFQTLVAFAAILADLSIIAVAGIAFTEAMVWKQYKISSFVGMALLGYVLLIWLVILLWWRNNAVVKAVRSSKGAETIGGVMRYFVFGGKMNVEEAARLAAEWEQHRSSEKGDRGWRGRRACFGLFQVGHGKGAMCLAFVSEFGQRQKMLAG